MNFLIIILNELLRSNLLHLRNIQIFVRLFVIQSISRSSIQDFIA